MNKSFFNFLVITLLFSSSIALGQERSPESLQFERTANYREIGSVGARVGTSGESAGLRELTSEELDQIYAGGFDSFLASNENQTSSPPWIILWDEVLTQRNASLEGSIKLQSGSSFMHGTQMNSILK